MNHARRDLGCRSASEAALPGTSKTETELCHHARIVAFISMSFDTVSATVTRPSKWHQRRVVFSRPYVDIFSTNMEGTSGLGSLRMRQQNAIATVPLDVAPERRTERCSPRFRPGGRFWSQVSDTCRQAGRERNVGP